MMALQKFSWVNNSAAIYSVKTLQSLTANEESTNRNKYRRLRLYADEYLSVCVGYVRHLKRRQVSSALFVFYRHDIECFNV